jgi:superfamily II DNA or RNA helicase
MPITIHIDNVFSVLEGNYGKQAVKNALSFYPTGEIYKSLRNRFARAKKECLLSGNAFPTGVLSLVLPQLIPPVTIKDHRSKPPKQNSLNPLTLPNNWALYDFQEAAANVAIDRGRGVIWSPVSSGKTFIAAEIIRRLNLPTLYLVHRKELLYQTYKRFVEWLPDEHWGVIGDGQYELGRSLVASVFSLREVDLSTFDVLISDECHRAPANLYYTTMCRCPAYYRIGLSGTPTGRSDNRDMLLQAATGDIIYQIAYDVLQQYGLVCDAVIKMIHVNEDPRCEKEPIDSSNFQKAEEFFLVRGIIRNRIAAAIAKKYVAIDKRVLIFVKRIEHGETLLNMIPDSKFVHGGSKTTERLDVIQEEKGVLISTSIFEEGIDTPNFDVIINAAGGKSAISTTQKIGRGLRHEDGKKLLVFDFIDHIHPVLEKHSKARGRTYSKFGYPVEELSL